MEIFDAEELSSAKADTSFSSSRTNVVAMD